MRKPKPVAQPPALTLDSLSPHRCHYIEGDDYLARMAAGVDPYCGAPVKPGSAWCKHHHALVYRPMAPLKPSYFRAPAT